MILKDKKDYCVLRPLKEGDARELFRLTDGNRARLHRWFPWLDGTRTWKDTLGFIRMARRDAAQKTGFHFGIWKGKQLAGIASYYKLDWANKKTELTYWIAADYPGQGLVTQACRLLMDHAFGKWKLNGVEIYCAVNNRKSRAIPERLGFKKEGTLRRVERLYDRYVDNVVYGILAEEWKGSAEN